ncbi:3-hydroxyacyl-CoA dehydrogenase [Yimella sp. cx-573]|nr:3-hydroxyacyl-CoA dehydrogenase [Yimella sp. cx-573]
MTREIKSVGVIGLGTMGAGIVEVFVKAGRSVVAVDGSAELAERGRGFLTASLDRQVKRGKLDEAQREEILSRASFGHELAAMADVDLVIEAVPERLEIKTKIFGELDGIVRPDCVLATNTSSLSVTAIAAATKHPERVIGMHFFNPAPVLALVEVITTLMADTELVEAVRALAVDLGKKPVVVGDRAGFVANALLITYLARAIRTYETGHVSREDLDDAARLGIGLPMGPLTLSDLIGLDVVKEVCDVLYNATKEPSAAPPALLEQMVAAGRLGRKTGHGFYQYEKAGSGTVVDAPEAKTAGSRAEHVALIGDGPVAEELHRLFAAGGLEVEVFGPESNAEPASADLAFVAVERSACDNCESGVCGFDVDEDSADDDEESGCDADDTVWVDDLVQALPKTCIVASLDEFSEFAAGQALADDNPQVAIRLHAATKAGQIVEVARELGTDQDALDTVVATLEAAGVRTIAAGYRAGLVVDALLLPHLNDAVKMLDSGYATVADIDTAMTAGCGYPQGPFAYIDQLGAFEVSSGLLEMYDETADSALHPCPLLDEHVGIGRAFTG